MIQPVGLLAPRVRIGIANPPPDGVCGLEEAPPRPPPGIIITLFAVEELSVVAPIPISCKLRFTGCFPSAGTWNIDCKDRAGEIKQTSIYLKRRFRSKYATRVSVFTILPRPFFRLMLGRAGCVVNPEWVLVRGRRRGGGRKQDRFREGAAALKAGDRKTGPWGSLNIRSDSRRAGR